MRFTFAVASQVIVWIAQMVVVAWQVTRRFLDTVEPGQGLSSDEQSEYTLKKKDCSAVGDGDW